MKSGFDYKEYEKWVNKLGIVKEDFQLWLKQFLLQEAQRVVAAGKPRTPVDTGYLRNSWYIGTQNIVQGDIEGKSKSGKQMQGINWKASDVADISVIDDYLQVEIGLSADYASFIEYGHHSYAGRYMLEISINEVQRQLPPSTRREQVGYIPPRGQIDQFAHHGEGEVSRRSAQVYPHPITEEQSRRRRENIDGSVPHFNESN